MVTRDEKVIEIDEFKNEAYDNGVDSVSSASAKDSNERNMEKFHESTSLGWNSGIEFLMSCVAMSVGFGNIWRFPFTAYENGGGAFLIPYIVLLILVGKPFYYLEMIVGQFSGRTSIKVWHASPGLAGVGWAQMCSTIALTTYYTYLMALNLYYLIDSFAEELPWSRCRQEWTENCVDSENNGNRSKSEIFDETIGTKDGEKKWTSAELYFTKIVLKERETIDDGIGTPDWKLTMYLLVSWIVICLILTRGIKSTGKASYFLAIFPYVILIALLARAVTLEGAVNGIIFFVTPVWSKLADPKVWYAAVTQCFFSLSVCFGAIITYSSHNNFRHNIYRDVLIITTLDTLTSMMAGCTIFGILGNLAHEMGTNDIRTVVRAGTGLAFVSYPEAIAKFTLLPQLAYILKDVQAVLSQPKLFAVLFFLMMFVLGVGSAVGMNVSVISGIIEQFPHLKYWQVMYPACFIGFLVGLVYVTPGGQYILTLVDYYGTSFVVFVLAFFEITGFIWVYGFENFLEDVEFMLKKKPTIYWRLCWFIVTPMLLVAIFFYTIVNLIPLTYGNNSSFPWMAHAAGTIILIFSLGQIPLWAIREFMKNHHSSNVQQRWKKTFSASIEWGPRSYVDRREWLVYKAERAKIRSLRTQSWWLQNLYVIFGIKPKS